MNQFPELPGLFCWTAIEFRRYLSNLLVTILEGHAIDGIVFDLRRIPRTTNDPRSWSHLGYSCLERIPRELGIDIEDFLNQPSTETLSTIENWRLEELHHFLAAMRARAQVIRQNPLIAAILQVPSNEKPFAPWLEPLRQGVLGEVVIVDPPDPLAPALPIIDALDADPVPLLLASSSGETFAGVSEQVEQTGALGYIQFNADPFSDEPLPTSSMSWDGEGAVELEPVAAAQRLILELSLHFQNQERLGPFFRQLDEFFRGSQGALKYEDATKVRSDMIKVLRSLRQSGEFPEWQPLVERAVRVLRLCPIAAVEY